MNIVFVIDTMHSGGAAKKISLIAGELAERGYKVTILTDMSQGCIYNLNSHIILRHFYNSEISRNRFTKLWGKLKRIRGIVKDLSPDVVVSVLPHVSFYVKIALSGMRIPIVFSDETSFARKDKKFVAFVRHCFYNVADAVVILTENDRKLLGWNIPQKVVIHNPVVCPLWKNDFSHKKKIILGIGALCEWNVKGFDLLFKSFALLKDKYSDWSIWLAGDDSVPYRHIVYDKAVAEGIEDRVKFLGLRPDIYNVMAEATIYALSSRVEGFSLSMVEAISQGCACVAFDNHGVVREVSCGGKGVEIVEDGNIDAYAYAIEKLIRDEEYRIQSVMNGKSIIDNYSIEMIVDKWEELFISLK